MPFMLPRDLDVDAHNAKVRAWREEEAKRAAKLRESKTTSGGVESRHARQSDMSVGSAGSSPGAQAAPNGHEGQLAGVAPGPLTLQRAKADAVPEDSRSTGLIKSGAASSAPPSPGADAATRKDAGPPSLGPHTSAAGAPVPCLVGAIKPNLGGATHAHSSKYRNKPTNGYASIREAKRAFALKLMQEAGQIRNLREQVSYLLIPKQDGERACSYVADFVYEEFRGDPQSLLWGTVVEDCKGMRTDVYRIKRKLMLMVHGIRIRET